MASRQRQTVDNRPGILADRWTAQEPPPRPRGDGEAGYGSGLGAASRPAAPNKANSAGRVPVSASGETALRRHYKRAKQSQWAGPVEREGGPIAPNKANLGRSRRT